MNNLNSYFDRIDFDKLPNSFILKCNHGCKWHYIIKDKILFLENKLLFDLVKNNITNYLEQGFWIWAGFELQYKGIKPRIIIEKLQREYVNIPSIEVEVFCFNGIAKLIHKIHSGKRNTKSVYDEKFNNCHIKFLNEEIFYDNEENDLIKKTLHLSEKLAQDFVFVRVDWLIYENNIYFNELTFTPYSGFAYGLSSNDNKYLGGLIKL